MNDFVGDEALPEPIRVLHVDDDAAYGAVVATFLERVDARFAVETVTSARAGHERLAESTVDCVVSDYDMPGTNGVEFVRAVRTTRPTIPFILFTGKGSEEVASDAISAGATDYLQKGSGTDQYTLLSNRIVNAVERNRAETTMGEVQHLFSELADRSDDVLWLFTDDWRELVLITNPYEDVFGQPEATLRENPRAFLDATHPDDRADVEAAMVALSDGESVSIEFRVNEAENYGRHVWVKGSPITDAAGTVTHVGGFTRDITEQVTSARELEQARDLLNRTEHIADVGGWEIDTETMEVFWTDHLFEILGVAYDEEPPLEEALDIYHEEDRPVVASAVEDALEVGEPFDVEARFRRPDGEVRWLRIEGEPECEDGTVVRLRGAVQDVTDRKDQQRALERQNRRLEEFAGVVSHDLRSPLQVAEGRVELAAEECETAHLEAAREALERMETIVDDVLRLASEGRDIGDVGAVSLREHVEAAWTVVAAETDSELTFDADGTDRGAREDVVLADATRLRQLLENLLRNAVDHGGTDVTVRVELLEEGFAVEDDGPGIPSDEADRIFEKGYTTGERGNGIGLSIVRDIAAAHGWEVIVSDGAAGGARFEIRGVTVGVDAHDAADRAA